SSSFCGKVPPEPAPARFARPLADRHNDRKRPGRATAMPREAEDEILLETGGGVATITIDAPDSMNRLHPASLRRFAALTEALRGNDGVHAVVVTGAGDEWFCAGLMNPEVRAAMTK